MNIVVFGSGWVVRNRHIPSLIKFKNVNVRAIVNPNLESAKKVANEFKIPNFWSSLDQGSALEDISIAVIGTPPHVHLDNIRECIEKDIKYILVEKPFSLNSKQAKEVMKLATEKNISIFALHNFLYLESYIKGIKKIKSYGKIKAIVCHQWSGVDRQLPKWISEPDSNIFFDESPHLFYLLKDFVGDFEIESKSHLHEGFILNYKTDIGANLTIDARDNLPLSKWDIEVFCEKGYVKIDLWRDMFFHLDKEVFQSYFAYRTGLKLISQEVSGLLRLIFSRIFKGRMYFGADVMFAEILNAILNTDKSNVHILEQKHDGIFAVTKIEEALRG